MRVDDLDFHLPQELIAVSAAEPRDAARLLVVSRSDPDRLEHRTVRDLPDLLAPDDTMVFNTSRVLPARFLARNLSTGGRAEGLWLHDEGVLDDGRRVWVALLKARRHRPGRVLALIDKTGEETGARLEILGRSDDEAGAWRVAAWNPSEPTDDTPAILERAGLPPLPPYIRGARREAGLADEDDRDAGRYQTVYADSAESPTGDGAAGSVAAPTAGLHFTPELLDGLDGLGVRREQVVLHVGTGTFKPVEVDDLDDHPMHAEWCSMTRETSARLGAAGRVFAVGTTSARTVEAYAQLAEQPDQAGREPPAWLETDLLIQPGYPWRRVDGMMTNFHLPRSTLLAMVAALFPGRVERVREIYAEAIRERYRFYSYGDAMLILP